MTRLQFGIQTPACPCWKALSLFLNRDGRTKSHPRASNASSFLRSGSWRKDSSLILILAAVRRYPLHSTKSLVAGGLSRRQWTRWRSSVIVLCQGEPVNAWQQLLLWLSLPFQICCCWSVPVPVQHIHVHACWGSGSARLNAAGDKERLRACLLVGVGGVWAAELPFPVCIPWCSWKVM